MDKQFYRTLLILVNDKDVMDKVHSYATARVEVLRNQLEITQDIETICAIQGAIRELRRLETLRDEVIKGAE
jgi:hypothetical protein